MPRRDSTLLLSLKTSHLPEKVKDNQMDKLRSDLGENRKKDRVVEKQDSMFKDWEFIREKGVLNELEMGCLLQRRLYKKYAWRHCTGLKIRGKDL